MILVFQVSSLSNLYLISRSQFSAQLLDSWSFILALFDSLIYNFSTCLLQLSSSQSLQFLYFIISSVILSNLSLRELSDSAYITLSYLVKYLATFVFLLYVLVVPLQNSLGSFNLNFNVLAVDLTFKLIKRGSSCIIVS